MPYIFRKLSHVSMHHYRLEPAAQTRVPEHDLVCALHCEEITRQIKPRTLECSPIRRTTEGRREARAQLPSPRGSINGYLRAAYPKRPSPQPLPILSRGQADRCTTMPTLPMEHLNLRCRSREIKSLSYVMQSTLLSKTWLHALSMFTPRSTSSTTSRSR